MPRFALNELFSAKHYLTHRLESIAKVIADHPQVMALMLELANIDVLIEEHPDRVPTIPVSGPGSNTGHGHVWARPDGVKAPCGGPGLCAVCQADLKAYGYGPKHG